MNDQVRVARLIYRSFVNTVFVKCEMSIANYFQLCFAGKPQLVTVTVQF